MTLIRLIDAHSHSSASTRDAELFPIAHYFASKKPLQPTNNIEMRLTSIMSTVMQLWKTHTLRYFPLNKIHFNHQHKWNFIQEKTPEKGNKFEFDYFFFNKIYIHNRIDPFTRFEILYNKIQLFNKISRFYWIRFDHIQGYCCATSVKWKLGH